MTEPSAEKVVITRLGQSTRIEPAPWALIDFLATKVTPHFTTSLGIEIRRTGSWMFTIDRTAPGRPAWMWAGLEPLVCKAIEDRGQKVILQGLRAAKLPPPALKNAQV